MVTYEEACTGRADAVSMWTVPVHLRPAGQAFQVICMHAFGDVPLPPITGVIQGPPSDSTLFLLRLLRYRKAGKSPGSLSWYIF